MIIERNLVRIGISVIPYKSIRWISSEGTITLNSYFDDANECVRMPKDTPKETVEELANAFTFWLRREDGAGQ